MNPAESKYVESKGQLSRLAHTQQRALHAVEDHVRAEYGDEDEWLRCVTKDFPRFIPFLRRTCGLEFRGRVLEIGAGTGWLSAEVSKLPKVVEVVTTDFSPRLLKEQAPRIFKLLKADTRKITRMPADFHKLDFPNGHFDFVVCSAVLHHAANVMQTLREARRVLKPGGLLIAIREPVRPAFKLKTSRSRSAAKRGAGGAHDLYTLAEYRDFFERAGFRLQVKRVNLSAGFKYYFNKLVNGWTHARYAFIAAKPSKS